jgi:outer membrane protein OmpA-like peptidoglycan-associated protein
MTGSVRGSQTSGEATTGAAAAVSVLSAALGLAFKLAAGLGFVAIFAYLFFVAHFFPIGLSVGDSVLFVFAFLAVGFQHLVLVGLGLFTCLAAWVLIAKAIGKQTVLSGTRFEWIALVVSGAFSAISIALLYGASRSELGTLALIVSGVLLVIVLEQSVRAARSSGWATVNWPAAAVLSVVAFTVPWLGGLFAIEMRMALKNLGLAHDLVSVRLSETNARIVQAAADHFGVPVFACRTQDSSGAVIDNVIVLWHGIGERSQLVFAVQSGGWPLHIDVERQGLTVMRGPRQAVSACLELEADLLFDSGSDRLSSAGALALHKAFESLRHAKARFAAAHVVGHTDPMQPLDKRESNAALSLRRADVVRAWLEQYRVGKAEFQGLVVTTEGRAYREPRVKCGAELIAAAQVDCHAPNRRVEIKLETPVFK